MKTPSTPPKKISVDRSALLSLRRRFSGTPENAHKQMGLRALRDALALEGRNQERVAELIGWAKHHLLYAEAAR